MLWNSFAFSVCSLKTEREWERGKGFYWGIQCGIKESENLGNSMAVKHPNISSLPIPSFNGNFEYINGFPSMSFLLWF